MTKRLLWILGSACLIAAPASAQGARSAAAAPTFNKDVAPILFANCIACHRPGEIAPMSLLTYQDARPWAKGIKAKVVVERDAALVCGPALRNIPQQAWVDARRKSTRWSHGPTPARLKVRAPAPVATRRPE